MTIVAVDAGGVAIVVEHHACGGIVRIDARGKRMADLREFGEYVRNSGRNIRSAAVAREAVLLVRRAQQTRGALAIVRRVAGEAGILANIAIAADAGLQRGLIRGRAMNSCRPPG